MAVAEQDHVDADTQFINESYLTYIVPFATDFRPETALAQGQSSYEPLFEVIEQRQWLFFDETVDIYLVLRTSCTADETLRSFLQRLVIVVEAQIVNSHAPERDSPPASEVVFNGTVENIDQAYIVVDQVEGGHRKDGDGEQAYALWKLPVFLARPRIRLQGPSVTFSATASLKPAGANIDDGPRRGYLQSRMPSGLNLLESFSNDPALGGVKPQLSAVRVSMVAPVTQSKGQLRPLRGLPSLTLKIYAAVHTRVRFARPNTTPPSPALIAQLEVDFTPFFDCEVSLDKLVLHVTDGTVEDLNNENGMGLPLLCVAHDHVTFLYRLGPGPLDAVNKNAARDLDISIDVTALVRAEGPNVCTPKLSMAWITPLDFTLPVNPGFGQPITQPIQRAHRPSQLSIGGGADARSLVSPSVSRPDALPTLEAATNPPDISIPDFGITMTFSGPTEAVHPGEEFCWTVFVVNRSKPDNAPAPGVGAANATSIAAQAGQSRKLALLTIPKRRRNELRVIRPPSTAGGGNKRDPLIADAVLDENIVNAMQRSSVVDDTEMVCLSADVRVGPLAPNACAVVELRFLALREGIIGVEAIRVVDLGSQEHVDVRELPVVVVKAREEI